MTEKKLSNPEYVSEILEKLSKNNITDDLLVEIINDYHPSDIADALEQT